MSRAILITGATGKQGGATIDALLATPEASDLTLLAVTRNTTSTSAQKLAEKSSTIHLVQGNLDDPEAIFKNAMKELEGGSVWGIFAVQTAIGGGANPESEERQGKALIDAALANGVKFYVQTSVDRGGEKKSDTNPTDVPHFTSKHHIEQHLREKTANGEMDWTILRPTAFMEGFTPDFMGKMLGTMIKNIVKEKPLQYIATRDIGGVAARAFTQPETYKGRAISLAGDSLTYSQLNEAFRKQTGNDVPTTFGIAAHLLTFAIKDVGAMLKWFVNEGYETDIPQLRKEYPPLMDFKTWLETESAWKSASK